MILAGDVGGTKCNLAVFDDRTGMLRPIFQRRLGASSISIRRPW